MIEYFDELKSWKRTEDGKGVHSHFLAAAFKKMGFWRTFKNERVRLQGMGIRSDWANMLAEGHVHGMIVERNRVEGIKADDLGVDPVSGKTAEEVWEDEVEAKEAVEAEERRVRDFNEDRQRKLQAIEVEAEGRIRLAAVGLGASLNEEVAWVNKNIHRPWSQVGDDAPSEGALTLLVWANENEKDFRIAYHSKPKTVKDEATVGEEVVPESEQRVMERIERLLGE